jgi:hypothetical protein
MKKILSKIKRFFCRHDWEHHNLLIYNPDCAPKENMSDIRKNWLYETKEYMESIGLEGLLPYFFSECKKCGHQTQPGIDTLIKATIVDYYIPAYYDGQDIEGNYPVVHSGGLGEV